MDTLRRTVVRSCGLARQLGRQQGARSASSLHPHNKVAKYWSLNRVKLLSQGQHKHEGRSGTGAGIKAAIAIGAASALAINIANDDIRWVRVVQIG